MQTRKIQKDKFDNNKYMRCQPQTGKFIFMKSGGLVFTPGDVLKNKTITERSLKLLSHIFMHFSGGALCESTNASPLLNTSEWANVSGKISGKWSLCLGAAPGLHVLETFLLLWTHLTRSPATFFTWTGNSRESPDPILRRSCLKTAWRSQGLCFVRHWGSAEGRFYSYNSLIFSFCYVTYKQTKSPKITKSTPALNDLKLNYWY